MGLSRPNAGRALVWAGVALLASLSPPQGRAEPGHVRSLIELRNDKLIRQHWDVTCGAAAVATLMTYQLGVPVSEWEATLSMLRASDVKLVRARLGFSLLDLKRFAASRGIAAAGYGGLTLDDLVALAPVIAPIRVRGFGHFVVVRGRSGDRLLLGDPAFGNRTMSVEAFEQAWPSHIGFVLFSPSDPHPLNRMGAPPELFLVPSPSAVRMANSTQQTGGLVR